MGRCGTLRAPESPDPAKQLRPESFRSVPAVPNEPVRVGEPALNELTCMPESPGAVSCTMHAAAQVPSGTGGLGPVAPREIAERSSLAQRVQRVWRSCWGYLPSTQRAGVRGPVFGARTTVSCQMIAH